MLARVSRTGQAEEPQAGEALGFLFSVKVLERKRRFCFSSSHFLVDLQLGFQIWALGGFQVTSGGAEEVIISLTLFLYSALHFF